MKGCGKVTYNNGDSRPAGRVVDSWRKPRNMRISPDSLGNACVTRGVLRRTRRVHFQTRALMVGVAEKEITSLTSRRVHGVLQADGPVVTAVMIFPALC
jgi:hypothetical protein